MSHTKEIWRPDECGMYILACDPDGNQGYVAVEIRGWGRLSKLGDDEAVKIQKDRARRIAALWNAAERAALSTEDIENGKIERAIDHVRTMEEIRARRRAGLMK